MKSRWQSFSHQDRFWFCSRKKAKCLPVRRWMVTPVHFAALFSANWCLWGWALLKPSAPLIDHIALSTIESKGHGVQSIWRLASCLMQRPNSLNLALHVGVKTFIHTRSICQTWWRRAHFCHRGAEKDKTSSWSGRKRSQTKGADAALRSNSI